jgi:hypothetical protein
MTDEEAWVTMDAIEQTRVPPRVLCLHELVAYNDKLLMVVCELCKRTFNASRRGWDCPYCTYENTCQECHPESWDET